MPRLRIEIDLDACHSIACPLPAIECGKQLRVNLRLPGQRLHAQHHPHLGVPNPRDRRALGHQSREVAADDGTLEQIDSAGAGEGGLRPNAGPEPEGVVSVRIHPGAGGRLLWWGDGGRQQQQRQRPSPSRPFTSNSATPAPRTTWDNRA